MILRATSVLAAGSYDDARVIDSVILDWEGRNKRRGAVEGVKGTAVLVDLPEVVSLRMDDALVLEDGRLVQVVAEAEALMEVKAGDAAFLTRLAWHIGNRHLAVEIRPNCLRLRADHVIADMLKGLGAGVRAIEAPFDPEGGAYLASAPVHAHAHHGHAHHGHDHDHAHGHAHHDHDHAHDHKHGHAHHDHAHHDHAHDHKHDHAHHDHGHAHHDHAHDHKHGYFHHDHDHKHGPAPAGQASACGHDHHHDHHHHDHKHG